LTKHFSEQWSKQQSFANRHGYSSSSAAAEPDGSSAIFELYKQNHRGRQQLDLVEEEKGVATVDAPIA